MLTSLKILSNSLRLTIQELTVNKLRTSLSFIGVAFGIFCIIGVLATVTSLKRNIQDKISTLGSNTIYIDKWDYTGGPDRPMWKYRARPIMTCDEVAFIKERSQLLDDASYLMRYSTTIAYGNSVIQNAVAYGITESQANVQPLQIAAGRYISSSEFNNGSNVVLIGNDNAEKLYGSSERAVNKTIDIIGGKKAIIVGVINKEGKNFIGWDYDNCVMLPYKFAKQMIKEDQANPVIIAKGKAGVTTAALNDELEGIMRQVRKLSPKQEDNFSLNTVEAFTKAIDGLFGKIDAVGGVIGIISLIVGMFGIANIMFVTVKERTAVIGLKKAIGAKRSSILFEFLMEATILCLMGGAVGLFLVYILTLILSGPLDFPVYISFPLLIATVIICLVVGVIAGIFPASRAAKMDPVVAIRS
ncbi:MAG TPA: ABC transporter permease [Ferruginibacter sp.]|jgi:putative ABC transport system permease protein|nr:ABC transporter permease [Ferruginibacter sp.]